MSTLISRRAFFCGLAAPAIVHAGNLMPVKMLRPRELVIRQAFVDVSLSTPETAVPSIGVTMRQFMRAINIEAPKFVEMNPKTWAYFLERAV